MKADAALSSQIMRIHATLSSQYMHIHATLSAQYMRIHANTTRDATPSLPQVAAIKQEYAALEDKAQQVERGDEWVWVARACSSVCVCVRKGGRGCVETLDTWTLTQVPPEEVLVPATPLQPHRCRPSKPAQVLPSGALNPKTPTPNAGPGVCRAARAPHRGRGGGPRAQAQGAGEGARGAHGRGGGSRAAAAGKLGGQAGQGRNTRNCLRIVMPKRAVPSTST